MIGMIDCVITEYFMKNISSPVAGIPLAVITFSYSPLGVDSEGGLSAWRPPGPNPIQVDGVVPA